MVLVGELPQIVLLLRCEIWVDIRINGNVGHLSRNQINQNRWKLLFNVLTNIVAVYAMTIHYPQYPQILH